MGSRRKNKAASSATSSLRDLHEDGKGRALPPGNGDDARNYIVHVSRKKMHLFKEPI
jgi:hypothetical protein